MGDGARLRCERAAEKNPLSNEPEPKERAPRGFPAKRPLANVRRGRDPVHPVSYTDDSRISHRTRLQWTPLFFTLHRDAGVERRGREGTTNPLVLFSVKTPYLAEKICESDRQIREKNLTNHRIVSLPSLFPERKNIAVETSIPLPRYKRARTKYGNEILLRSYSALWNIINIYSTPSASSRPLRSTIHARIKIRRTAFPSAYETMITTIAI